ncbi:hypothetical protein PSEUBRA_000573 [Kalmanozyma brasiliensis GHG001]|uniref:uncharacterized protein n=1 Tax=Kalmanozyma brasiliensis (strain GHG001) TaxID=1365824 RepID=UPI002867D8B0|nr:uncharacterized protein PSEUBRA_000573 [Kalmanozyma brasiliensis GHG001]EST10160.2 hypothetical protein PSEUBRA_000573 [Kalmanozyma brasiliensis GHG001]
MAKRLDAKARLLWRSDLVLIDGTRLPGLAIVSYANPFDGGIGGRDDTQGDNHEAEAELCLALEMLRNQPLHISAVTTDRGSAPVLGAASQKQSHWVASGEVRVYIDPRERATWSFFNRTFCFDADFVEDAGAERSAQVVSVSLQPSLHAFGDETSVSDPFAFSNAAPVEYAIFAQPTPLPQRDDAGHAPESMPIRLVLGRRVTVQTKRVDVNIAGRELSRSRSFHRQQSVGSQSLHDVFTQAGLSLPTFGGPASAVPRPDDPLPRGSISALLQARSKRKPALTHRHTGAAPVGPSTSSQAPVAPRTPGRRGEKRHASSSDRKVAGSPSLDSQIKSESSDLALSPTKAIKHRADRILSDLPRLNLSKQPTRIVVPKAERADSLDIPPVKTESVSPEPFSDTKPLLDTDTIEKTNRTTIKKITHTLLVREHNLTKSDPDYIASYHQTCAGTWCAFRHVASIKPLAKDAVETVVRIHLSLYLHSHRA